MPDKSIHDQLNLVKKMIDQIAKGNFNIQSGISDGGERIETIVSSINLIDTELRNSSFTKDCLDSIYENSNELFILTDQKGALVKVNKRVYNLLKIDPVSFDNENIDLFFKDKNLTEQLFNHLNRKGHFTHVETMLESKSGDLIPVVASGSVVKNDNQQDNFIFIFKDLIHIKRYQNELDQKNKELEAFLYTTSHQIKGPLASILGLSNLINDDTSIEEFRAYFQHIKNITKGLNNKIVDLVEFPKIGTISFQVEEVEVVEIINEVYNELKDNERFATSHFQFLVSNQYNAPYFSVKKIVISIFRQLLSNAVKYQQKVETPEIRIDISSTDDHKMKVLITDHGQGINPTQLQAFSEMFTMKDPAYKGSGLGLYIVKKHIDRLGGEVWIESSDSKGSTIGIVIPSIDIKRSNAEHGY